MGRPRANNALRSALAIPILRNNSFFVASTACVGLANYLLNTTAARRFPPGAYSQFGIMLNLLAAFVPVATAAGTAVTRRAIQNRAAGRASQTDAMQRTLLWHWSLLSVGGLLLVALARVQIGQLLRLTTTIPLLIVVVAGYWSGVQGVLQSVLQEQGRYGRLSAVLMGEGIFRGSLGVAVILAGGGISGALTIYALSALLLALWLPRPPALPGGPRASWEAVRPVYRDISQLLFANLCVIVLSNLDIVLCRRFLAPETADRYVAIASLAKFFLFATASINAIAFAELIKAESRDGAGMRPFVFSLALVASLGVPFILFCGVAGRLVMGIAFGSGYRASGDVLWVGAVSACAVSVITLEITYFNARMWFWYLPFLFAASGAILAALPLADGQLRGYASVYAIGTMVAAALLAVPLGLGLSGRIMRPPAPGAAPAPATPDAHRLG